MKKLLFIIVLPFVMSGCGQIGMLGHETVTAKGEDVAGCLSLENFNEIDVNSSIIVNFTKGDTVSIKYTAPQSLVDYLDIKCKDKTLVCEYKDNISVKLNGRKVVVDVTAPDVNNCEAHSAGIINILGTMDLSEMGLDVSSAARINLKSAHAKEINIAASSSGVVMIDSIVAGKVDMDASSAAEICMSCRIGTLTADCSSAANVTLKGACEILNADVSSGGALDASDLSVESGSLFASSGGDIIVTDATTNGYNIQKSSGGRVRINKSNPRIIVKNCSINKAETWSRRFNRIRTFLFK